MSLAGQAVVAIWNGIAEEGRTEFYEWHNREHMPERVGIPGFRRGRRYIACDSETAPEFFTLYEADSPEVLVGQDYLNRLNDPTAWTKRATQGFRNTSRALTRVHASYGPGSGGIIATIRFGATEGEEGRLRRALKAEVLPPLVEQRQITGAHLCVTNAAASAAKTAESRDRTDILAAPDWVILIEGCNPDPVRAAAEQCLRHQGFAAAESAIIGLYRLEYTRLKTAHAPG